MWVLGTQPRLFPRAVTACNCCAISPAPIPIPPFKTGSLSLGLGILIIGLFWLSLSVQDPPGSHMCQCTWLWIWMNLGPQACIASIFPTEPSPQPWSHLIHKKRLVPRRTGEVKCTQEEEGRNEVAVHGLLPVNDLHRWRKPGSLGLPFLLG